MQRRSALPLCLQRILFFPNFCSITDNAATQTNYYCPKSTLWRTGLLTHNGQSRWRSHPFAGASMHCKWYLYDIHQTARASLMLNAEGSICLCDWSSSTDAHSPSHESSQYGQFHELLNISDLLHSVSEVVFLYNSAEFKGILHITHFFVTIFFVIDAKINILPLTSKSLGNYFNISHRKAAKFLLRQTAEPSDRKSHEKAPDMTEKRSSGVQVFE